MRLFELETDDNTVYFTFINANPPTFGYTRALDKLRKMAGNADSITFVNPMQNNTTSPLHFDENVKYLKKIFTRNIFDTTGRVENPIQALKELSKRYNKIYFLTRDKNVREFKRMYTYAEQWGVDSFEIVGLGDSSRPLPTGTSKEASLEAVLSNDYEAFKKTIPSNDKQLLSQLFIDLRKRMIDGERDKEETALAEATDTIYHTMKGLIQQSSYLSESVEITPHGHQQIVLEGVVDILKNLKLVFNPNSNKNVKMGRDLMDNNMVIITKCKPNKIKEFMDLNEVNMKKAIRAYLNECVTSANIATVPSMIGGTVKRDIDYSIIDDLDDNSTTPKYVQAVNKVLNTYGYMDQEIANRLRELIDNG